MTSGQQVFISIYRLELADSLRNNPDQYAWTLTDFDEVFTRMEQAIIKGTFNKDSDAFKRTCKKLGIKHTYKAIREYCAE
jgi:hypothetical protein